MPVKNIIFDDYTTASVASDYESARASGIRKAQEQAAPATEHEKIRHIEEDAARLRATRKPVVIPQTEDGEPDYRLLDLPPFKRPSANRNRALATLPVSPTPAQVPSQTAGRQSEGITKMSGAASGFIAKMKSAVNNKLGCVDFSMSDEDLVAFRRFPDTIAVGDRAPSDDIILAMLEMGKSDFGAIEVYGSPEFIAHAVRVAVDNGIVLQNKEYAQALAPTSRSKMRA